LPVVGFSSSCDSHRLIEAVDPDVNFPVRDLEEAEAGERHDLEIAIAMSSRRHQSRLAKDDRLQRARGGFGSGE
jgi:hypothetical protein